MQIAAVNFGPGTFVKHLVARAHRKAARRKGLIAGLMLTSMVDMFSLLVIFLLQTFSASPEIMVSNGVMLPDSSTSKEILDAPVLALSAAGIYLDQKFVGLTDSLLEDPSPLMKMLQQQKKLWITTHPTQDFKGEINLQADKSLSSALVAKFMGMLPSQQYGSIRLAVVSGGSP